MTGFGYRRSLTCAAAAATIAAIAVTAMPARAASTLATPSGTIIESGAPSFTLSGRPVNASYATAAPGLLQTTLRDSGMDAGMVDHYGLIIGGYGEIGYSYNFQKPPGGDNGLGRIFDDKAEDWRLDQLSVYVMREALISRDTFDMGFGIQLIYGSDSRFIHANGANFYGSAVASNPIQRYPDEQIDLTQLFFTLNLPVGNGLLLTGGKFVTPWGLEHLDPTRNLFYSHTMMFSLATPKTLTGLTATYQIDEQWGVMGGVVTGWDQSVEDNNDFPSLIAQLSYRYSDDWDFVFTSIVGPEQTGNRSDFRWLVDATATYHVQRDWTVGFETVALYEPGVGTEFTDVVADQFGNVQRRFLFTGGSEFLFGITASSSWRIDDTWTLNARLEYFNDSEGGRWFPAELWSLTGGFTIVPFPDHRIGKNFMVRPEVRWDYSEDDIFDGGERNTQITVGVDAIYKF